MTLAQIIRKLANRHRVHPDLVGGFVKGAIVEIISALDREETVKIQGLGTFCWKKAAARPGGGVLSKHKIPPGKKLKFVPAQRFKHRRTT